jgi:hypothetical protein
MNPSGDYGGDRSRCVQAVCLKGQEGNETVDGVIPERPVWHNGCKPFVLSEVREQFDGH